ncbi:hypothetical protein [Lentilactobacillus rapi]|uniref:hypothetical protein n=1 Tax=Lentilactobacillus rapi TaxID=481723 RepID=UPI0006D1E798|nr:hypothetical protein [Lentilactobacillus rapi]
MIKKIQEAIKELKERMEKYIKSAEESGRIVSNPVGDRKLSIQVMDDSPHVLITLMEDGIKVQGNQDEDGVYALAALAVGYLSHKSMNKREFLDDMSHAYDSF